MNKPLVVSIGTTHPQNVAGLGLDARVASEYGVAHAMAVAAVSAQDERGVADLFVLPSNVLAAQLDAIDFTAVAAVRIGALGSTGNLRVVRDVLERGNAAPVLFDPVMRASAGGSLYAEDPLEAMRALVQGAAAIVTPNIDEAQQLSGIAIRSVDDMIAAGTRLLERGARAALVKGGHLCGDPVDVLVTAAGPQTFGDARLPGKTRGTGCTLAMALACELAQGRDLVTAVKGARAFVRANIARS